MKITQKKAVPTGSRPVRSRAATPKTVVAIFRLHIEYDRLLCNAISRYNQGSPNRKIFWHQFSLSSFWEHMEGLKVDGVVGRFTTREEVAPFLKAGLRVITWMPPTEQLDIPVVTSDDVAIGAMVANYYLDRGFRRFAFVNVPAPWSHSRHEGFRRTVEAAHFSCDTLEFDLWPPNQAAASHEHASLKRFLLGLEPGTGLMAANDATSQPVIVAARDIKLAIPADLAVVGVDDDESLCCRTGWTTSSSVPQDYKGIVRAAMDLMWQLLDGAPPPAAPILVPPLTVRTRQTSDIRMVGDPHVAKALAFIAAHLSEPIGAVEIARAAGVSERVLRYKFNEAFNRSPYEELLHQRIQRAQTMLTDSADSNEQIAAATGFGSLQRFYVTFRSVCQMSPKEYRQKHQKR